MSAGEGESKGDRAERPTQALEVLGRLTIACASDSPASLMAAHMSLSCAGRLRSASADGVVVEIPNPPETELRGCTAAVTFPVGETMTCFLSQITEVADDSDGPMLVTLALPEELRIGNRRSTVRVPVPRGILNAAIVHGPARGSVEAVDISLLGILIEIDAERTSALRVGDTVPVRLSVGTIQILLDAEVRRQDGRRFGLLFPTGDGPPPQMTQIMWRVQAVRLPSR